ncbi:MAG: hypothetical protein CM1200mP16_16330 [Nitrospina sp.]|nr:MAG: hypothetical protein CM1200mP16_16330 [Nitrospina sp.]
MGKGCARAGGFIYPWGDDFKIGIANLATSPRNKTGRGLMPVGSFPKAVSPYGVHDMVGNIWEWVWDYYLPYPNSKFKSAAFEKKHYILRGMSYMGVGHFNKKDFQKVVAMKSRASFREHLNPLAIRRILASVALKTDQVLWNGFLVLNRQNRKKQKYKFDLP